MAHRSTEEEAEVRSDVADSPTATAAEDSLKDSADVSLPDVEDEADGDLPQCKIKRNYSCNLCTFFSQNPRSFLYHSRDVHFDRIKIYECSQCLYASKHSQKLQRHINMIHVAGKTRVRKEKKKEVKPRPPPPPLPPVSDEPKMMLKPEDLMVDDIYDGEEEDLVDGELRCSVCQFTSSSRMIMRRHEKVVHLKKRFLRCGKCSYVTHVKARFTKHVKYHSMPMIKCDLCDFRTPYKWNLDRHYKNHCGSGAFQCSKCNFRADIKQSLTVHEMNHHVPPVGQGAVMARKKNKVGASETTALESDAIDKDELELLRLEREDAAAGSAAAACSKPEAVEGKRKMAPGEVKKAVKAARTVSGTRSAYNAKRDSNKELEPDFIHPDDVVPRYGQMYVKSLKCKFCSYKAVFNHEIWRHEKRIHGYTRPELRKDKVPNRPPPQLIPIQNKPAGTPPSSPILKIPSVKPKLPSKAVNETEFNEMCKKSSLTSSLKDFVSLIGDEEGLKHIPDPLCEVEAVYADADTDDGDAESVQKYQTDLLKKKNASFFDKLKEKLTTGNAEDCNLTCEICGHESKCLSESLAHKQRHGEVKSEDEDSLEVDSMPTAPKLSSTRCQHCRQRCKTSTDLMNHLKVCKVFTAALDRQVKYEEASDGSGMEDGEEGEEEEDVEDEEEEADVNRVLDGWNQFEEGEGDVDEPVYGAVTTKGSDNTESGTLVARVDPRLNLTVKKVFKCPHCSFWASTASRFHVHIVGHLNKKPFECSLCLYRSNWRWDITKHIRLKSARDPRHLEAQVNMTDETGRRNYSKYNKYLTMMKVQEPSAESSGTGRRTRACDATQGTVTDDMIQPLPAPPRLTRAPTPGTPRVLLPQGAPLRPPPPLKAAHQVPVASSNSTKKTLWKCKKCNYRDSDKESVLAHVKQHYSKKKAAAKKQPCTLPKKIVDECSSPETSQIPELGTDLEEAQDVISCDVCPFVTETEGDLTAHKLNHVDRPGSIFKCSYCPFYVPSKIAVLEHMEIHGVENADEIASLPIDNFDPREWNDDFTSKNDAAKRYKCRQCPYVSNCKTQFLYHKQFHRPRNAPFKCMYCSYNVTRRHLLHQHLRVHHMNNDTPLQEHSDIHTIDMPEIPLVWVQRAGGNLVKMFKCRWCPHVNLRKLNIQEHEKMHKAPEPSGGQREGTVPFRLQCSDCTYMCNNPGVLSSHIKVHQGLFGEIRSLVDPTRPDAEQIKYLLSTSQIVEPEVVIKEDQESDPPPAQLPHPTQPDLTQDSDDDTKTKLLNFCNKCPARFFFKKELRIHAKFHLIRLPFRCPYCTYTARQRPHLLAHYKVHSQDYQEKTAGLVDSYIVSGDCPQPKTAMVTKDSTVMEGPVWMVVSQENMIDKTKDAKKTDTGYKPLAKHACHRCPAKFFKTVALQYHLTLHGGSHQHKCKYCDYTVKTYGNLIKHQLVHEDHRTKPQPKATKPVEVKKEVKAEVVRKSDPQFGTLMHGRPDFIYPTYLKNGKVKEKRYKCHKCPSAFEKRDQYKIHLSLHGSKQKYKCETCDYSVKYYANYVQHMRKHQLHDEAIEARKSEGFYIKQEALASPEDILLDKKQTAYELTLLEQQTLCLQEKRKILVETEDRKVFWCAYCPYTSHRRDAVDNHTRRHYAVTGSKSAFECPHCDYTVSQGNFMREHIKLHFAKPGRHKPEGYLKYEKVELWYNEDEGRQAKVLVFKDKGEEFKEDRFDPPLTEVQEEEEEEEPWKVYVNPETGEPVLDEDDEEDDINGGDSLDMLAEQLVEEEHIEDCSEKPKRLRGKNWKCKKCPHAFSKKDQFLRHISLHGSNQKHPCDICDYSVKFYTNYIQHMRMHQMYEPDKLKDVHHDSAGDDSGDFMQFEPEVIINGDEDANWSPGDDMSVNSDDIQMEEESHIPADEDGAVLES